MSNEAMGLQPVAPMSKTQLQGWLKRARAALRIQWPERAALVVQRGTGSPEFAIAIRAGSVDRLELGVIEHVEGFRPEL